MKGIDLQVTKLSEPLDCVGGGFVALDVVHGRLGDFLSSGGSCGNVMAILGWFGWNAAPAARLGRDAASEFLLREFEEVGVRCDFLLQDDKIDTPIVVQKFVERSDGVRSHRFLLSCPDCGSWLPRFRAMTLKQSDSVLESAFIPKTYFFDRVAPSTLKLASWARQNGALVVFEPQSIGDERAFQKAVELCHILKFSNDRLGHVPDLPASKSPEIVIETLGEEGLRMRWKSEWRILPSVESPVFEDAAGSGDWCTAGLIHRIGRNGAAGLSQLRQEELEAGLRFGQGLAAVNCAFEGARGAMMCLSLKDMNKALSTLFASERSSTFDWKNLGTIEQTLSGTMCNLCTSESIYEKSSTANSTIGF